MALCADCEHCRRSLIHGDVQRSHGRHFRESHSSSWGAVSNQRHLLSCKSRRQNFQTARVIGSCHQDPRFHSSRLILLPFLIRCSFQLLSLCLLLNSSTWDLIFLVWYSRRVITEMKLGIALALMFDFWIFWTFGWFFMYNIVSLAIGSYYTFVCCLVGYLVRLRLGKNVSATSGSWKLYRCTVLRKFNML